MGGKFEGGEERLEAFYIHSVPPNPVRPTEGDVGKLPLPAVEALEPESPSYPTFPNLFGVKADRGEAGKAAGECHEEGRLSCAGEAGYEEVAFSHGYLTLMNVYFSFISRVMRLTPHQSATVSTTRIWSGS